VHIGRQRGLEQRFGMRAMPRALPEADRVVEPFACQVDLVVVGHQAQVDERMVAAEGLQPGQQPAHGEGGDRRHRERLAVGAVAELLQDVPQSAERVGQHGQQGQAFVGERQPARQPAEQRDAKPRFQVLDLRAHCRLRDVQFQSGPREAQVPGRCFEGAQCVEGQRHGPDYLGAPTGNHRLSGAGSMVIVAPVPNSPKKK
jgi:hypothetical protein